MDPLGETRKAGNATGRRLQASASRIPCEEYLGTRGLTGGDEAGTSRSGAAVDDVSGFGGADDTAAGVPRIISYARLHENGKESTTALFGGDQGPLYGATGDARNNGTTTHDRRGYHNSCVVPGVSSKSSTTIGVLKPPIYGSTGAGGSAMQPLSRSSHTRSKTVEDAPSSTSAGWWRRKDSWFGGNSDDAESSKRSLFGGSGGGGPPIVSETIVYAPSDGPCPPQTPLLGSSKMVANVRSAELRRQVSRITWAGTVSVGAGDDDVGCDDQSSSMGGAVSLVDAEYLEKVRSTFYQDAITFAEGTIPQSIVMSIVIGIVCGCVAFLYYSVLFFLLDVVWKDLPNVIMESSWPEHLYVLYIPLVTISLSTCCGLSIYLLGEPGDLAFTIKCVHEKAYEGTSHIIPMVCASLFSILAGASLGPEAPLVGVCAATAGFISRRIFKQRNRNVVRKHTLMGMSGALAAFFGVPLGGSLFALEVTSRFSIEYFEHVVEAIACGEVCVAVFRWLAKLPLENIWQITPTRLESSEPILILVGACIGLLGAGVATLFASFHWRLMGCFNRMGLLDDENRYAVPRVLLAAVAVTIIGMLIPQTMFWGEFEFNTVATMSPASNLRHIWPTSGLIGFEMDSWDKCLIVGVCKIIAISFTVAGGYRGGFIFPFFVAGAAFGRALVFAFPSLNPAIACLCFAAGINVAITRTALATSLILSFLSDEMYALPAILAASISSLFATSYMPFIKTQIVRSDIDHSLFYKKNQGPRIQDTVRTLDGLVVVPAD